MLDILDRHYDLSEFRELCFNLRIDYDNLGGGGKRTKARELIMLVHRTGQLNNLLEQIKRDRPLITLPDFSTLHEQLSQITSTQDSFHLDIRNLLIKKSPPPFMAPKPPELFTMRGYEYAKLKSVILNDESKSMSSALIGGGGFGKTALVSKICWDENIQNAFPDGILWITLGQTPNIPDLQSELIRHLTQQVIAFKNPSMGTAALNTELKGKHCLIIIDDAWELSHVRYFNVGDHCTRIITSRILDTITDVPPDNIIEIDRMTNSESLQMLTNRLNITKKEEAEFAKMATRLGNWAILLEIVNSMLIRQTQYVRPTRRRTPIDALKNIEFELNRVGVENLKITNLVNSKQASVRDTISITFAGSQQGNHNLKSRFFQLGIFPEDAEISIDAAARLWNIEFDTALASLENLDDMSLLKLDIHQSVFRLHDVIREVLRNELTLEDETALHQKLIKNYGNLTKLPDVYAWKNIIFHLERLNARDDAKRLLSNPAFMYGKIKCIGIASLISDYHAYPEHSLRIIKNALFLMQLTVETYPEQFYFQLYSRLIHASKNIPDFDNQISNAALHRPKFGFVHAMPWLQQATVFNRMKVKASDKIYGANPTAILSNNGQWLIFSDEAFIKVWDFTRWKETGKLEGHNAKIHKIIITSDDKTIISVSQDGEILLWDFVTGNLINRLSGPQNRISDIALTSDDKILLSASKDGTVCSWDANNSYEVSTLYEGLGSIGCLALTPDDHKLVAGTWGGRIHILDMSKHSIITSDTRQIDGIHSVSVHPIKPYIAAGTGYYGLDDRVASHSVIAENCFVCIYDLHTGEEKQSLYFEKAVTSLVFDKKGENLIVGTGGEVGGTSFPVEIYDGTTLKYKRTLGSDSGSIKDLMLSYDEKNIIVSTDEGVIHIWNILGDDYEIEPIHSENVEDIVVTPDGKFAVSGAEDGSVYLHDLRQLDYGIISQNHITTLKKDIRRIKLIDKNTINIFSRATRQTNFILPEPVMNTKNENFSIKYHSHMRNGLQINLESIDGDDTTLQIIHERSICAFSISNTGVIGFGDITGRVYFLKPNSYLQKIIDSQDK